MVWGGFYSQGDVWVKWSEGLEAGAWSQELELKARRITRLLLKNVH